MKSHTWEGRCGVWSGCVVYSKVEGGHTVVIVVDITLHEITKVDGHEGGYIL